MLTIPNALSIARGLGIPLFLWAYLGGGYKGIAFLILVLGGLTDYLDGKLARALNQESELGAKLDPAIDRLYLATILFALAYKGILPWILVGALVGRDLILGIILLIKRTILPVTYLGKSATFNLLYALPLLLLDQLSVTRIIGWAFAIWGIGLYLLSGAIYASIALRVSS